VGDRPLWLGSVKSNIGHTQAASGMAGVIKMVQAMRHGTLPKSLHAAEVSPIVDWPAGQVEVLTEARPWERDDRRRAGVSSFGVSGTNAHIILEEDGPLPVEEPARTAGDRSGAPAPWLVSARSEKALRAQAAQLLTHLESTGDDLVDIAHSLLTGRAALEERAVVVGSDRESLAASLRALAAGTADTSLTRGTAQRVGDAVDTVFVFPGQGSQWVGMAVGLLDSSPVFAARFAEC
ncbi:ketoacyl-synthetase C-terminal extension domain-containing protein, partial [Streptomyces europaeiscabiei]